MIYTRPVLRPEFLTKKFNSHNSWAATIYYNQIECIFLCIYINNKSLVTTLGKQFYRTCTKFRTKCNVLVSLNYCVNGVSCFKIAGFRIRVKRKIHTSVNRLAVRLLTFFGVLDVGKCRSISASNTISWGFYILPKAV